MTSGPTNPPGARPGRGSGPWDAELEAVLDGAAVGGPAAAHRIVDAARRPGTPAETTGLDAALAQYALHADRRLRRRRAGWLRPVAAATLTTKLVIGGVAAAATAGIVVAAEHKHLTPAPRHATSSQAPSGGNGGSPGRSGLSGGSRPGSGGVPTGSRTQPGGTAASSLPGLCRTWLARPDAPAGLGGQPAYAPLVTAAGGVAQVNGYCLTLLRTTPSPSGTSTGPSDSTGPNGSSGSTGPSSTPTPSRTQVKPTKTAKSSGADGAVQNPTKTKTKETKTKAAKPRKTKPAKPTKTKPAKPTKTKPAKPTKTKAVKATTTAKPKPG